jgi:hypothetical protein
MNHSRIIAVLVPLAASACGAAAGTHPNDMSAADHQKAADEENSQSGVHAANYDPAAAPGEAGCSGRTGAACWSSSSNPTSEHLDHASQHRELAAKHRAASEALRNAETSACSGIPEEDRDMSPFMHRDDVSRVSQLDSDSPAPNVGAVEPALEARDSRAGKTQKTLLVGADIEFKAVPGMTAEWLQRVVDCHSARNAALGYDLVSSEMPGCPLAVKGATGKVHSTGDGFTITVRAEDQAAATEIWRRAQHLGNVQ